MTGDGKVDMLSPKKRTSRDSDGSGTISKRELEQEEVFSSFEDYCAPMGAWMHSASNASKIDDEQPRSWKLSGGGGGGNFCPRARAQTVARGIDRMTTRAGSNALSLAGNTNSPMMTVGHSVVGSPL
jgi:hypothetical protein